MNLLNEVDLEQVTAAGPGGYLIGFAVGTVVIAGVIITAPVSIPAAAGIGIAVAGGSAIGALVGEVEDSINNGDFEPGGRYRSVFPDPSNAVPVEDVYGSLSFGIW